MKKFELFGVLIVSVVLLLAGPVYATSFTIELNYEFSEATAPEGDIPWLTATFDDDTGDSKTVRLTMNALGLTDAEWVSEWYFNFSGTLMNLSVTTVDTTAIGNPSVADIVSIGENAYKADGNLGSYFDILFYFKAASGKLTDDESVSYLFTSTDDIDIYSFINSFSVGSNSGIGLVTAAHVQSIGDRDEDSGWITFMEGGGGTTTTTVPEPASLMLFGMGLLGAGFFARRKVGK